MRISAYEFLPDWLDFNTYAIEHVERLRKIQGLIVKCEDISPHVLEPLMGIAIHTKLSIDVLSQEAVGEVKAKICV